MHVQFYHVHRSGLRAAAALLAVAAIASACGKNDAPRDTTAPKAAVLPNAPAATAPAAAPAPSTPIAATAASAPRAATADAAQSQAPTVTSAAIARGREILNKVRAASGGDTIAALKTFAATGRSEMSALKMARTLEVRAQFPTYFWQEEAPPKGMNGLHTIIGMQAENIGWILGARLGGDGASRQPGVANRAYTHAARQAMAGMIAGINPMWLVDSKKFTPTDAGVIQSGEDKGALSVIIDGPEGRTGVLIVDPNTFRPRRLIEPPQKNTGGQAGNNDIVFTYADFRTVKGMQLPYSIVRTAGNIRTVWTIAQYRLNPRFSARDFSPRGKR